MVRIMENYCDDESLNRVERLVGPDAIDRLKRTRVALFGVGGVGGWAAEALVRTGIGHLTIVDADKVCVSNINRQPMAATSTVGRPKVEVLAERLADIAPGADVKAVCARYTAETAAEYDFDDYDFVIDAIDSLADKALLILNATRSKATLVSSMGAALKMDPTRVKIDEFWKVKGCRLAAALRNRFKRTATFPGRKFKCVYSDEIVDNRGDAPDTSGAMTFGKVAVNGALVQITATFGMFLTSIVVNSIVKE